MLDRPHLVDSLTEVLSTVRLHGALYCSSELSAPWGITFLARECAAFHVVDRGSCWLRVAGQPEPIALRGGDLVLLPQGDEHTVSDTPRGKARVVDFQDHPGVCGPMMRWGGGGEKTRLVCGEIYLEEDGFQTLRAHLPRVMHLRGDGDAPAEWLQLTLKFLASETSEARPGSYSVITRLIDILFVQAIRVWLSGNAPVTPGWLAGLREPAIASALALMHSQPGKDWTVESLARQVGMSRSAFSELFVQLVGEGPLTYLTRWRMHRAAAWLRSEPSLSVIEVAQRVGYDSEAAFNRAFKRALGTPPGAYRREGRAQAAERRPSLPSLA
ncbi:AraC family transcriptional regulator [Hyalangium versicolor]|uniref:AraC family transcriptional regulator n=1 Tax=Hyalangium versicolor TaxID=2861190 RepID=UPI001CCAC481|nr:AraC family transcriptional regulator [Hyalangium versicolor]